MILEAQEGDILFGSFDAGPNTGIINFRFDGTGRDVLSGITFTDKEGNYVATSLNDVSLLDIFHGKSNVNYHGSNPSFRWGGLLRGSGDETAIVYLNYKELVNAQSNFFSPELARFENYGNGVVTSMAGSAVAGAACATAFGTGGATAGACASVGGAVAGATFSETFNSWWTSEGRMANDLYVDIAGYEFRFRHTTGWEMIYHGR